MSIASRAKQIAGGDYAMIDGKNKMTTEDVVKCGNGITLTEFMIAKSDNGEPYPIFLIKEFPDACYSGGQTLTSIVLDHVAQYGGDVEQAQAIWKEEGGLHVKLSHGKTKAGRDFTKVEVIED